MRAFIIIIFLMMMLLPSSAYAGHTLTTTVQGFGTITKNPNKTSYNSGEIVTLTAAPEKNYIFGGWSGAATSKDVSIQIAMIGSKTVTAVFGTKHVHVAPTGIDTDRGTSDKPVATLKRALLLIDGQPGDGEIIIHGGTYSITQSISIASPKGITFDTSRKLLIRAADGERPMFDGSAPATPTPLESYPGIYLISGTFTTRYLPQVWEENNRIRYNSVADLKTLMYTDYGVVYYSSSALAIRPKDGVLPLPGELRLAVADYGLNISRDNVTVRGLSFTGFGKYNSSSGIYVGYGSETSGLTDSTLIEYCSVKNSSTGFYVGRGTKHTEVSHCTMTDVSSGLNQWGGNSEIHHCDMRNDDSLANRFRFKDPDPMTGGLGIRVYYNATGANIHHNLIVGFGTGIRIKTIEPAGPFVIEHNTLIDDPYLRQTVLGVNGYGVAFVRYSNYGKENSITRYNIMDGFSASFTYDRTLTTDGAVIDKNLFWYSRSPGSVPYVKEIKDKGMGENTVGDPLFVDPQAGDFRLMLNSPGINLSGEVDVNNKPIPVGAFGAVDANVPLSLRVSVDSISGKQYGSRTYPNTYDIASDTLTVTLFPSNTAQNTKASILSLEINNKTDIASHPFTSSEKITLPVSLGRYMVSYFVQDSMGVWSKPFNIRINKVTPTPIYYDAGYARANRYGFVVFNKNSQNQWQTIYYRKKGETDWIKGFYTLNYQNTYAAPYADMRYIGEQPMIVTSLEPEITYEYKIIPNSGTSSPIYEIKTTGEPRVYYISPNGMDARDRGAKDKPFRTLQYAIDLSLPGDNIRLLPGVYFGPSVMFHSGVPGYPITIESDIPGTASIDAEKLSNGVLLVSGVSDVIIRNLVIQWGKSVGLYAYNCNRLKISGNIFQNATLGAHSVVANAITISTCNNTLIHHNLIKSWWNGGHISASPNTKFYNNTILATAQTGLQIADLSKSQGSSFTFNTINFNGNHPIEPTFKDGAIGDIILDYNNYGTTFQSQTMPKVDEDMKISLPYSILSGSQGREFIYRYIDPTISGSAKVYYSFIEWRKDTGLDAHSIFADPKWNDVPGNNFTPKSDSPNLLGGCQIIGAFDTQGLGVVCGDLSNNGEVCSSDASLASKISLRGSPTADELKRGDVNGDGKIDAQDAVLIGKKAVGLIDRF